MEQIVSENLFLIEFVVDKCIILPCAIPNEVQTITGETCVSIQFLNNEPLNVCEEDFERKRKFLEDENVKSGKSCLFAMSPEQAEVSLQEFNINVWVFKKFTNNMLPDKTQIGTAVIPAVSIFTDIIDILNVNNEQQIKETVTRTLKDNFNILNSSDEVIGSISIFLRMSCFGKLIVTQFQMNLEDKLVYFKDKEGRALYKYRKASKKEMEAGDGDGSPRYNKGRQFSSQAASILCEPCNTPNNAMNLQGAGEGSCICISSARPNSPVTPVGYMGNGRGQRLCKNQALTMRGAGDPNRFGLNLSGCHGPLDRNVTIVPPVSNEEPPAEKKDSCLDVFILNINKKTEKKNEKSNFEVQLITPRGDDPQIPPRLSVQETQYEGGGGTPSDGKKGKGGKGRKGSKVKSKKDNGDEEEYEEKASKNDKNEKNKIKDDKISLPAFVGGILLKERKYDTNTCCANDWPVCRPPSPCKAPPRNQTCCCDYSPDQVPCNNWTVPSNTSLYCSMGKIRSAVS